MRTHVRETLKWKRGNVNIESRLRPREIYELITSKTLPYKTDEEFYQVRDRALLALLYLTAGRISEVLMLKKSQFDSETETDFIIIRDMKVIKRRKETIARHGVPIREEVPLPKRGHLSHFTSLVIDYLMRIEDKAPLFPSNKKANPHLSRVRAWQIVNGITGQWCHYFRSQSESHYGRIFNNLIALADFVRVENIQTLREYVKTSWQDYRRQLSE
jgi:integrase